MIQAAIANVTPESQTLGSLSMNAWGSSSTEAQNGYVVNDENEQSDDECIGPTHNAGDGKLTFLKETHIN